MTVDFVTLGRHRTYNQSMNLTMEKMNLVIVLENILWPYIKGTIHHPAEEEQKTSPFEYLWKYRYWKKIESTEIGKQGRRVLRAHS